MIATTFATVEEAAEANLSANWMSFNDFSWDRSSHLANADQYCLVYTVNRDSGLLDQSNAEAIHQAIDAVSGPKMSWKNTTPTGQSAGSMAMQFVSIGGAA